MSPDARRLHAGAAAGAVLLVVACRFQTLDALSAEPIGPEAGVGADATAGDIDAGDGSGSEVAGNGPDSNVQPDDAPEPPDAMDAPLGDGGAVVSPCTGIPTPVRQWTFDTDVEGWTSSMDNGVQATLTWTSGIGMPSPGALQLDINPEDASPHDAWVSYVAVEDLTGRTLSAWAWLDSGSSANLKLFVETGARYVWADNGTVILRPRTWTCLSLAVSSPSYANGPSYDPSNVVMVGLQLTASSSPVRVFVDTVAYR